MRLLHVLLRWLALLPLAGCSGPLPPTTELGCSYGEIQLEVHTSDWRRDVLLVVEPALIEPLEGRLRALVRGLVTGELDDEPGQDGWAIPHARVSVASPSEALALWNAVTCAQRGEDNCPIASPPFVRYRWAPHGYEDDVEAFVERVMCLAPGRPRDCASDPLPGEPGFGLAGADVLLILNRDLCGPFGGGELPCDRDSSELLEAWTEASSSPSWWPSVIAGFPADLTTSAAWQDADDREVFLQRIDADPRMRARGEDVCAGAGPVIAEPAPELLRAIALRGDGVTSICSPDYRPVLGRVNCTGVADYGLWTLPDERVFGPDGARDQCDLFEVLPAEGPVTRCAQLTRFGRSEATAVEDGREVCRVQHLSADEADAGLGAGFYVAQDGSGPWAWPSLGNFRPPCTGLIGGSSIVFARTQPIAGSILRLHCATVAGAPELGRCEQSRARTPPRRIGKALHRES